ncbi:MAG TPA: helix-turn-helix transcriptional regulator [Acidimicrobiales bacterium]
MTDATESRLPGLTSPTVARRWLGREMRRRRLAAGLSEKDTADALRSTASKVSYTESGKHSFKPRDLTEVLLPLYGVPEEEWPPLLEACRRSRTRGWWQTYDEEIVPDWLARYIGLEQGASSLRSWEALYPHGLLQTERYAEALMRHELARFSDDEVEARLEVRMHRRSVLTREGAPLEAHFILDEAILRRVVGGPEVMVDQLEHLAEAAALPNVTLQVLPFSRGPHPDFSGSFTILGFGWDDMDGSGGSSAVYVEGRISADFLERGPEVQDHEIVFDQLAHLALPPDESIDLVRAVATEFILQSKSESSMEPHP